ncbi:MAG: trigger factor [Faecalibacterium sp.]
MKLTQTEQIAPNVYQFTLEADHAELAAAAQNAYETTKENFLLPGYEKGAAPREAIEEKRGDIFTCDGLNNMLEVQGMELLLQGCAAAGVQPLSVPEPEAVRYDETGCAATLTVAIMPEVKLIAYKGLRQTYPKAVWNESVLESELNNLRRHLGKPEPKDAPAEMEDTVKIDFCGKIGGVEFSGGAGENFELQLGSNRFIPGFEKQIVGHSAGETFDVFVKFPVHYPAAKLAGQDAVFQVVLREVAASNMPELTDELVHEVTKLASLEELKAKMRQVIQEKNEQQALQGAQIALLEKIATQSVLADIPAILVEEEYQDGLEAITTQLRLKGLTLEEYIEQIGLTKEVFEAKNRQGAAQAVRSKLALLAVAKQENLTVSPEEILAYVEEEAPKHQASVAVYQKLVPAYKTEWQLLVKKAIDFVMGNATFVPVD